MDIPIYKFEQKYLGHIPIQYTRYSCKYLYKNILTYILIASCRTPDKGISTFYTGIDIGIKTEIPIPAIYLRNMPDTYLKTLSEYNTYNRNKNR
jgi:hypothetical protein